MKKFAGASGDPMNDPPYNAEDKMNFDSGSDCSGVCKGVKAHTILFYFLLYCFISGLRLNLLRELVEAVLHSIISMLCFNCFDSGLR